MTRFSTASVAVAALLLTAPVRAMELWDPHLRGTDEGTMAGALPPPGVYGVLDNYVVALKEYDSHGKRTPVRIDAIVEIPILLWQTGYQVLGQASPSTWTTLVHPPPIPHPAEAWAQEMVTRQSSRISA